MHHAMGRKSEADRFEAAPSSRSTGLSASHSSEPLLPASLGIRTSSTPSKSLSERLKLHRHGSSSSFSATPQKSSDELRFSDTEAPRRNAGEFGSFPSIPSWGPQTSHSFSTKPNRIVTSNSTGSLGTAMASSSSRDFLVPIGATGARQKLSISRASQRRRLAASEDANWAPEPVGAADGSLQQQRCGLGMSRSRSDFHILASPSDSADLVMSRSISATVIASAPGSGRITSSATVNGTQAASATPAELVQQAAMQRLSSQRILPTSKYGGVPDNVAPSRYLSSLSSSTAASPAVERAPAFASATPSQPVTERSTDSAAGASESGLARTTNVVVPDRTTSSLKPTVCHDSSAPIQPVHGRHRQADAQRINDSGDRDADSSITSKPLTLAESYKRAMLERDAERAKAAARAESKPPGASTSGLELSAPTLNLNLPTSSFFFEKHTSEPTIDFAARPASSAGTRCDEPASPKVRDRFDGLTTGPEENAPVLVGTVESGSASVSTSLPQADLTLLPRQTSYDEAALIEVPTRPSGGEEPSSGLLHNGVSLARRSKEQDPARSYLALRDDEEEASERKEEPISKLDDPAASPAKRQQARQVDIAAVTPTSASATAFAPAPASAAKGPQTPPADKSFVQFSTPEREDATPKAEAGLYDLSPSRTAEPSSAPAARSTDAWETDRPTLPREMSLQTLRSPPHKFESQPGPREEAALQAGASAAAMTSPKVSVSEAPAAKRPTPASPANDRTVRTSEEGSDALRRSQDALAALSPAQQSRFSEASTDLSDSRAPTRTEHRYSGRASSISSGDIVEEESTDGQMLPTSAWHEVENALRRFRDKASIAAADRGNLLRTVLLPFLALEAETATVDVVGPGPYADGKARRALFFDWIRSLLLELQHVQTSADRGAILESIACIIESRNFSASILSTDAEDEARFSSVFGHILSYAIGELNKKGVYQNTLIFSGRLLAVAFFRVNGVATKLLRALPVNRFALERVAREFDWQRKRPVDFARFVKRFPAGLRQLCYKDSREYLKMLDSVSIAGAGSGLEPHAAEDDRFLVCQPEVEVEMSGNWLRRWQSDDSELFFSFCRSYHRQLASLFASSKSLESVSKYFFGGPGYAHLATCVHQKCLALVHRVILSVTTLSSQKNFNPAGETANVLSGSTAGKPRILEAANRRCTAIVVDIVRAPAGGNMIFAPMLGLHIKALIRRTSLYDVQGVFCLLDWLDGVISHMDTNDLIAEGLVDVSFIITTIGMLLENADHALALMRTIAFCYANFGVLTATTENRIYFCEQILLKPNVFHKLFLSWSFTIRAYYLHLLVFRLARIRDFPSPKDDPSGRSAVRVVRLFNQRLEALRKRHDALSPEIDSSSDDNKSEDSKSRKSGTSTFVSTIKRTSTDGSASIEGSVDGRPKAEKIMAMTAVGRAATPASKTSESKKSSHSKTKSWLKAFRSGSSKPDSKQGSDRESSSPRHTGASASTTGKILSPESDDDSKTIGSARTTPRTSFDSTSSDTMSDVSTLAGSVRGLKASKSNGAFEFDIKQQQPQSQQAQSQQPSRASSHSAASPGANAVLSLTHDAGIAKDTVFDLQSTHAHRPPTPGRTPQSPRVSKAFARRASMLPGPASELVAGLAEGEDDDVPPVPDLPIDQFGLGLSGMVNGNGAEVYDETLHIYAVQSLREYEQTVQEHDEFFASLPEEQGAQVPRLPVNWPAMWSSTGD